MGTRLNEDYIEAKAIILKSMKSKWGKQLTEFKRWEQLGYTEREQALRDLSCPKCHEVKPLTGSWSHIFGTEKVCSRCSDEIQFGKVVYK